MRTIVNNNKKILIAIFTVVAIAMIIMAISFRLEGKTYAECVFDQFNEGEYTTQTSYTDEYGNTGFAVFSREDGKTVKLSKKFNGVFDTTFIALKQSDGKIGSTLIDFVFEANNGKTFSLSIKRNGSDSFAYVTAYEKKMGIDQYFTGFTSMMNRADTFPSVKSADKYTVIFDPSTMTVYVNDKLIWDFSKDTNDGYNIGFTLEKFNGYEVSLVLERSTGESALSFYSLCGEDLGGQVIRDTGAPTFFVDKKADAIVDKEYFIPVATVTDYVEGNIGEYFVDCIAPDGNTVFSGRYVDGVSFTAAMKGEYSLVYYATDKNGRTGTYTVSVNVFENDDSNIFLMGETISFAPLNSSFTLPCGVVDSSVLCYDTSRLATRRIYFSGEELTVYSGTDNEKVVLNFDKKGTYTVNYSYEDCGVNCERSFDIVVSDNGYEDFSVDTVYAYNATFVIPTVNYYDGSNSKAATPVLTYPSGKTAAKDCILDESGEYSLKYSFEGKADSVVKAFNVTYSASGLFDVEYGSVTDMHSYIHDKLVGVQVALTAAGTLKYNNVIDFSDKTKNDYFIELIATPSEYFTVDFATILIRLTDTEDPDNWVEIKAFDMASNRADGTYVRARRNGTPFVSTNGVSATFKPTAAGYGGYPVLHSFRGSANRLDLKTQTLKFAFDPNDKCLYSDSNGMDPVKNYHRLVADLCDPTWCGEWNGFTNNTAYLSITCTSINTIANFMVLSVDGNNLGHDYIVPSRDPSFTVTSVDENDMPFAVAGEKYKIPDAYATDAFNNLLDIDISVYENYGLAGQREITVSEGSFTPDKAGDYSIKYHTHDYYGNEREKILSVTAYAANAYDGQLRFEYTVIDPEHFKDNMVGKYIALKKVEWRGGAGYLEPTVKIVGPDGIERQPFTYKGETVVFADKQGSYNVTYSVKDYIEKTHAFSLVINAASGSGPALADDLNLPEIMIEGVSYKLPTPQAYFSSMGSYIDPTITITDGNGTYTLENDVYKPVLENNATTVKIVYSYGGTQIEKIVNCRSALDAEGGIDLTKYFTTQNGTLISSMRSLEFVTTSEDNFIELNIPVPLTGFKFSFDVGKIVDNEKQKVAFSGVDIILSDYFDPYYKILLSYKKSGDAIIYSVNNGTSVSTEGSFTSASAQSLQFTYSSSTFEIYNIKAAKIGNIKNYLTGESFDGFKSGFVNIKMVLTGVTGESSIELFSLNGQPLTSTQLDRIKPIVYTQGDFGGRSSVDDVISTGTAMAYDIISGVTNVFVSVKSPSGVYVKSLLGKDIKDMPADTDYQFRCTETGQYEIVFTATDNSRNRGTSRKLITVVNETPPSVVINGEIKSEVTKGTVMMIPLATETSGKSCTVNVMVVDTAESSVHIVTNGKYAFNKKGTFIVRYFVFDEFYNCVITDYTVKVV